MSEAELMAALTTVLVQSGAVTYLTAGIKRLWLVAFNALPKWLGPFKAMVGGWVVAALSKALGVDLPTDLTQLNDSTTLSILTSGVIIGALGSWVRNLFDGLKKRFGSDTRLGTIVRALAGKGAAVPVLALGALLGLLHPGPAIASPYVELRYTLLGNIPSVIGDPTCPCIGSQVGTGWVSHPSDRWTVDTSVWANFQTRWDDPESYQFGITSEYALGSAVTWLLAYEQRHNFDRPSQIPDEYLDFRGRHERKEGNFLWGISGLRYLWTGMRVTFP